MATFENYATLTYTGGTTNSNTVTGELTENLAATKTAIGGTYTPGGRISYVLTLVNRGAAALTGLTVTDDLGGYLLETETVYPLRYLPGTLRYYVNGVLQTAPTVNPGPPMTVTGITVPAGGNVVLAYETQVTGFAPLDRETTVTNTATVTGRGLYTPVRASATVGPESQTILRNHKSLCPAVVAENGRVTYTFLIENTGNTPAAAGADVTITDTFRPILTGLTVTYNGTPWVAGTDYTYSETTGVFATVPGRITVPAATYSRNAAGEWITTPGAATVTVTGTI